MDAEQRRPRTNKPLNGPERSRYKPLVIVLVILLVVALIYLAPILL